MLVPAKAKRHQALRTMWLAMMQLELSERRLIIRELRTIFSADASGNEFSRAMTSDEVGELLAGGLVTIGAHTATHPMLSTLDAAACFQEVAESKTVCEALSGRPITTFAYPFGQFNAAARNAVKAADLASACTIRSGPANAQCDLLALPRVHVPDVGASKFEHVLHQATIAS